MCTLACLHCEECGSLPVLGQVGYAECPGNDLQSRGSHGPAGTSTKPIPSPSLGIKLLYFCSVRSRT